MADGPKEWLGRPGLLCLMRGCGASHEEFCYAGERKSAVEQMGVQQTFEARNNSKDWATKGGGSGSGKGVCRVGLVNGGDSF